MKHVTLFALALALALLSCHGTPEICTPGAGGVPLWHACLETNADYACASPGVCFIGYCTETCAEDSDCTKGACYDGKCGEACDLDKPGTTTILDPEYAVCSHPGLWGYDTQTSCVDE
ncbi:MAG: hypothetical protein R3B09_24355 [Nannocystaceae bacterium]